MSPVRDREARFWAKVDRRAPEECWLWRGAFWKSGYGSFRDGRRQVRAHRVAWEIAHGPIPVGLHVLHACDRPACVNPDHLSVGTHAQNMAEMARRGRCSSGNLERNVAIIAALVAGEGIRSLARRLGVSSPFVSNIAAGRKARRAWATWMSDELAKVPRSEGRIPILGIREAPGTARDHRPRRLVVMDEADFIALHGPVVE